MIFKKDVGKFEVAMHQPCASKFFEAPRDPKYDREAFARGPRMPSGRNGLQAPIHGFQQKAGSPVVMPVRTVASQQMGMPELLLNESLMFKIGEVPQAVGALGRKFGNNALGALPDTPEDVGASPGSQRFRVENQSIRVAVGDEDLVHEKLVSCDHSLLFFREHSHDARIQKSKSSKLCGVFQGFQHLTIMVKRYPSIFVAHPKLPITVILKEEGERMK